MILKPLIRNNICLNSHPAGCKAAVLNQISYVREQAASKKASLAEDKKQQAGAPSLALIIGCSTGYGLASRIAAAFGYGTASIGVSFERPGSETKTGTPGWYNNMAFDAEAANAGLASITIDGDAFSDETKQKTISAVEAIARKTGIRPEIDLLVYSVASPVRQDPEDGVLYRSVIKPIGNSYTGKTMDLVSGKLGTASIEAATDEEIQNTVKVMGGEDWKRWIDTLSDAGVLSDRVKTVAYTYLGPELSWPIYRNGTIGRAKEDLEETAHTINDKLAPKGGAAWVSVNKALVTRASAVIPVIPLYISTLFKVMKEKGLHEGCIEQIVRLYQERLYSPDTAEHPRKTAVDSERRIRIDDWEMREDVQTLTADRMQQINEETLPDLSDVDGFRHDFLEAHGFDVPGVDYTADVDPSRL